ncbi:ferritin [Candidatus Woesearchaeota archaeon]|nr:ferritin [Candidatus Woesearchaeota archaeon]
MFQLFKCQICGDPYLGDETLSKCPFCGAPKNYIVEAREYIDYFAQQIDFSTKELDNFKKALDLEIGNASFYSKAAVTSSDAYFKSLFKALFKVENEHADVFTKHLKTVKPEIDKSIEADQDGHTNLLESHRREQIAIESYQNFYNEATTPRAKQIFEALVKIEKDHLGLED